MKKIRGTVKPWPAVVPAVVLAILAAGAVRSLSAGEAETYRGLKRFSDVIDLLEEHYVEEVDTREMIDNAIEGMVHSLDPHSQLLPPEAHEELRIDTKGEFGGIGIVITMRKGALTVISPIEGTPAYEAGVDAGDIITEVDGESTKEMMLWEAVKKMRGPKGEPVTITVVREGESEPIEFELVRDIIPIESVRHLALKPGYGYIRITNFQENTTEDLKAALADLESTSGPLKGLILDLRDNPGGLLDQAVLVSDVFLDEGAIVSMKGRIRRYNEVFEARRDRRRHDFPMVVLINGGSASASEIVAGAIQDHKRGIILGTASFGKGSVQTVASLDEGYGLKFTIARYYTPDGRSIQAQGIEPDIEVKQRYADEAAEAEPLLKEKDLKNHLEAEPEGEGAASESEDSGEKPGNKSRRRTRNRYGPLDLEGLREDNQVMRALGVLLGYDVFRNIKG